MFEQGSFCARAEVIPGISLPQAVQESMKVAAAARCEPCLVVDSLGGLLSPHREVEHGVEHDNRRVKTDYRDAVLLADLLRMYRLPEARVAPREIRESRELVRYRRKVSQLQSGLKAQVHQTLGKEGAIPETKSIWWPGGQRWLDELQLADAYTNRIESLRDLVALYHREIATLDGLIHRTIMANDDLRDGYEAIQAIGGVGRVLAAVFVAEIGDVHRSPNPRVVVAWAGMTPKHRESDFTLQRKEITKQGLVLVRWAAVEAVTGNHCEAFIKSKKRRIAERRGYRIGKVAAARELLTLVFYGLRDGEIRCLNSGHQPLVA